MLKIFFFKLFKNIFYFEKIKNNKNYNNNLKCIKYLII